MTKLKHWQDAVNTVLGAWLVLSPWIFGFQGETMAMATAVVLGAAMIVLGLAAIFAPHSWEEWVQFVIGLCAIAAPWVIGFGTLRTATLNSVVVGVIVAVLSLWVLLVDKEYSGWWRGTAH
jgi:uncharacterized membrane protein